MATDFQLCFTVYHKKGSVNPGWLEMGTHQLLVLADDVHIYRVEAYIL